MKLMLASIVAGGALALAGTAQADTVIDIDLAGWTANGGYSNAGNSNMTLNVAVGTEIVNAEYIDLTFESFGISWNSELRLSINDTPDFISFWDAGIVGTGNNTGAYGPVSATFGESPSVIGAPFVMSTNDLYIETYATFTGGANDFHVISSGILRLTLVPAPGAMALLGLAGLVGTSRRRS